MRTLTLYITEALAGREVKSLLAHELRMSGSLIARIKWRSSGILLNGVRVYTNARVRTGDTLVAEVGDDASRPGPAPMQAPLDILWEDADILILNKPADMVVHTSTRGPNELTVENVLAAHLAPGEYPHPVSRLDRGTTGIMTLAKNGYMHELLRQQLHTPAFRREYRAIAVGRVTPPCGRIDLPIGMAPGSTYQHAICQGGAPSHTEYETLQYCDGLTLLRLTPHTGRTHQLRLHMAAVGYPLLGDWLYGTADANRIARPALHSYELWLTHPLTGEELHWVAPLPKDMQSLFPAL
ncbi:MAG: RluA family pseudouridine synthase [Christensenellaceae bacterium]|jgi:23S rRNA pseudouridine1911/1915/1917 synthase|nr:RluA family pseudouridine synthase [Christensenellaceae bacterium]